MIYLGVVTRVSTTQIWVTIPDLGGDSEFGPLKAIRAKQATMATTALTTDSGGTPTHTHTVPAHTHVLTNVHYTKGDEVVVAQLGVTKYKFVVLGRV